MRSIINLISRGLDGSSKRQQAINNNIANVNTPGYKRQDVQFKDVLHNMVNDSKKNNSLQTTHDKHMSGTSLKKDTDFKITSLSDFSYKNDKNSVDIDVEMSNLAKNSIYYNTLIRQINSQFSMLNNVIERGGN